MDSRVPASIFCPTERVYFYKLAELLVLQLVGFYGSICSSVQMFILRKAPVVLSFMLDSDDSL